MFNFKMLNSVYMFDESIKSEIRQYCETLKEIDNRNDIGCQWRRLHIGVREETMDLSSNNYQTPTLADSQKVTNLLKVLNDEGTVSKSDIAELSSATLTALCLQLNTNLSDTGFYYFIQSLITWDKSPNLAPLFKQIIFPKMLSKTLTLKDAEAVAKCHPVNFLEYVLKPLLLQHPSEITTDILSSTFPALTCNCKHSLITDYLDGRPLDERNIPVIQAMLPTLPASALPVLAQAVHSSATTLSNNLTFSRLLLQFCRLHRESLTSSVKTLLLEACESNQTLMRGQIARSLEC